MAQQLSEAQIFDCCACCTFAARVAARLAAGDGLDAVVAAARRVWWHEVHDAWWSSRRSLSLLKYAERFSTYSGCIGRVQHPRMPFSRKDPREG